MTQIPQVMLANRFDSMNPLYRATSATSRPAETDHPTKEAKRYDRVQRELQIKAQKETIEAIETRFDNLGTTINGSIQAGIKEGMSEVTKAFETLASILTKQSKENLERKDLNDQPHGRNQANDQPEENKEKQKPNQQKTKKSNENIIWEEVENGEKIFQMEGQQEIIEKNTTTEEDMFKIDNEEDDITMDQLKTMMKELNIKITNMEKSNTEKIENKNKEIEIMKNDIENLKRINLENKPELAKKTYAKVTEPKIALQIDQDGNLLENQDNKEHNQPIDIVNVKNTRKKLPPRPKLSESTNGIVSNNLEILNIETKKQLDEEKMKMKKPQNISKTQRDKKIEEMFQAAACRIGIAPFTKSNTYKVCQLMTEKGILKKSETLDTRLQRTSKSLIKTWTKKNLDMKDEDWDEIDVSEISQTNSDEANIIFIKCKTREGISKITSRAKNLPNTNQENDPRLVMYVDARAKKRYSAIQSIAKSIRTKSNNTIQTSVRNGKYDFLLRQKMKGDPTPWGLIPPVKIEQVIPDFEIGLYKNIYTVDEKDEVEEQEEEPMNEEDNEDISKELLRQYEEDKKRSHSPEVSENMNTPNPKRRMEILPGGSEDELENDCLGVHNLSQTSNLHSTLREECRSTNSHKKQNPANTVPETPEQNNMITRYNSESAKYYQKTSHQEEQTAKTIQARNNSEIGTHYGC